MKVELKNKINEVVRKFVDNEITREEYEKLMNKINDEYENSQD